MVDVPVHADGTAVHDPAHARGGRGLDELAHRRAIGGAIGLGGHASRPVDGGDVVDDGDTVDGFLERPGIPDISLQHLDARGFQVSRPRRVTHERADRLCRGESAGQVASREAGRAGD